MPDIIILDIDGTIDKDVLKGKLLQEVLELFKEAYRSGAYFYIVTARRLSEFKKKEQDLLNYDVPKPILDFIHCATRKSPGRWLYYNKNLEEPIENVTTVLFHKNLIDFQKGYVKRIKEDDLNFTMGLHKMLQIEEIINKHSGDTKHVFFFDDAKYNYDAWKFYSKYINPKFEHLNFIGGKNKAVFKFNNDGYLF